MDLTESLTVRTVSALRRLADLEEKGRSLDGPRGNILKSALRELEGALEELRVAADQLTTTLDEMAETRSDAKRTENQFNEFRDLLPIGCVVTGKEGRIVNANAAASSLLNVAARHLAGKPLSLYMVDRDRFFSMLNGIRVTREILQGELAVRPRERKPRLMAVHLGAMDHAEEFCWFFQDRGGPAGGDT